MKRIFVLLLAALLVVFTVSAAIVFSSLSSYGDDTASPIINELMASNQGSLHDEDGDASDWIELYNPSAAPINLAGFSISDNRRNEPWIFPEIVLPGKGHLLVWASGKDRAVVGQEVMVVNGGGRDIWDVNDSFYFDYIEMEQSEFSIVARLNYLEHTNPWAKAGVMIRTGLGPANSHVSMFATPANGFAFQRRVSSGNISEHTPGNLPLNFPAAWVKLTITETHIGGVSEVKGFASINGVDWNEVGTSLLIGTNVGIYAGLAVTSQSPGNLAQARFSDVKIENEPWPAVRNGRNIGTTDRGYVEIERYDVLHTDFRLRQSGEMLSLFDPAGVLIDGVTFNTQILNHSFGRVRAGETWAYFAEPTPRMRNITRYANSVTNAPLFSKASKVFNESMQVYITAEEDADIFITLDGSEPTITSRRYREPLNITETTVIRAIAVKPGKHPSLSQTASFVKDENINLPVLSIVTDPSNLWDHERGIIHNPGQRGERWERAAAVSLLLADGSAVFDNSQNMGIRIHGGASRWVDKKSFRLYWRGGTFLEHPLFPNKPEVKRFLRMVVRSGGNDQATGWDGNATWVMMRCWLLGELWRQAGGNASSHLPVKVLLNGQSWGMYNLRERIDRYFLSENFNINPYNVDLIKYEHPGRATVQEGSLDEWNSLNQFFYETDLTLPENFNKATELIDIQNFTDYTIMQIYAGNWDWPQNNVYAFREKTPGAKWRWILWDIDDAFMMRSPLGHNTLLWGTRDRARRDLAPPWYGEAGATTLHTTLMLRKLLENTEYREFFVERARVLLSTVLHPDNVIREIEEGAAMMQGGVEWETKRWGTTVEQWYRNIERIKEFARLRPGILRIHLINYFDLDEETLPILGE